MADEFVPLANFVLQSREAELESFAPPTPAQAEEPQTVPRQAGEGLGELRRFRAAVTDAVDVAVRSVLCDVACEVLARDLELAPVNLEAIVLRACARHAGEGIVSVRVHPDEAAQLCGGGIDVIADSAMRRGDALLHVRSGTIDVTLGARLAAVLDRIAL